MVEHFPENHRDGAATAHEVQLFDSEESRADAVAEFFGEGFLSGDSMLAVVDAQHWYAIAMRMVANGLPVDDAMRVGQFVVRDAEATLQTFMRRDRPDSRLFVATVGTLVSGLAARGRRLRIYGEMVDVLAAQGDYAAARELEEMWNELGSYRAFTLFCGYNAAHFGDPRNAVDLRRICTAHSDVRSDRRDPLAAFLVRPFTTA
jgi:hypothetical protein